MTERYDPRAARHRIDLDRAALIRKAGGIAAVYADPLYRGAYQRLAAALDVIEAEAKAIAQGAERRQRS